MSDYKKEIDDLIGTDVLADKLSASTSAAIASEAHLKVLCDKADKELEQHSVTESTLKAILRELKDTPAVKGAVKMPAINIPSPNFPKEIRVSNIKDLDLPKPYKEVKVSNLSDIKIPTEVKVSGSHEAAVSILGALEGLRDSLGKIMSDGFGSLDRIKAAVSTKISNRDPQDAIPVRLVSKDGKKFIEAIGTAVMGMAGKSVPFKTSSGVYNEALIDTNGRLQVDVVTSPESSASTTPTVFNVSCTLANTEYSQVIPDGCDKFTFQCRGDYDVRWAFETGKVAGSISPFMTLKAGMNHYEDGLNLTSKTLYFACSTAGQVVEIISWS